jgi:hypothetical protein
MNDIRLHSVVNANVFCTFRFYLWKKLLPHNEMSVRCPLAIASVISERVGIRASVPSAISGLDH